MLHTVPFMLFMLFTVAMQVAAGGSIQGVVIKQGSTEVLPRAAIELLPAGEAGTSQPIVTAADNDGKFTFRNVPPGRYRMRASRNGYVRMEYGRRAPNGPGAILTVTAAQPVSNIVIEMTPTASVSGRITDRLGRPMVNASVRALKPVYQEGRRILSAVRSEITNDLGEYRLFWLPSGRYYIEVQVSDAGGGPGILLDPGGTAEPSYRSRGDYRENANRALRSGPGMPAANERYVRIYFPGTPSAESAVAVDVRAGEDLRGIDITVAPARTWRVRGVVLDETSRQPVASPVIRMLSADDPAISASVAQNGDPKNGTFDFPEVLPGTYIVFASAAIGLSGRTTLDLRDQDIENLTLTVGPGLSLPGRIALEGVTQNGADPNLTSLSVVLRQEPPVAGVASLTTATNVGGLTGSFSTGVRAPAPSSGNISADGSFTLQNVPAGDYRVYVMPILPPPPASAPVSAPPPALERIYVKSVSLGGVDVLHQGLHLAGASDVPLEIVVGATPGAIEGRVLDGRGEPLPGVPVVIFSDAPQRFRVDSYRTTTTDTSGRFEIRNAAPGTYRVFAWDGVENGAWLDPEFMRVHQERGTVLSVGPGSTAAIELTAIAATR